LQCIWDVEESLPVISALRDRAEAPSISRASTPTVAPAPAPALQKLAEPLRVSYLTEQTSHHPPVSAFYIDCAAKGLSARGYDQISAKFTGTSIKVSPGEHNAGIFIDVTRRDEQYQLTHPTAYLGGLLRGSLSISVGEQCIVTCAQSGIKTILHYAEEAWLGKSQNRVDGLIFRYDPARDETKRLRDVAPADVLARISGNWKDKIYFSMGDAKEQHLLVDLSPLSVAAKTTPPPALQAPHESLAFWAAVTTAIQSRHFSRATQLKQELEDQQRRRTRARQQRREKWLPRFFLPGRGAGSDGDGGGGDEAKGRPELTSLGHAIVEDMRAGRWELPRELMADSTENEAAE
jgi:hypothetical protein